MLGGASNGQDHPASHTILPDQNSISESCMRRYAPSQTNGHYNPHTCPRHIAILWQLYTYSCFRLCDAVWFAKDDGSPHNSILGAIYHVSELYKTEKVHLHFYCFSIKYETYAHSKASCQCDQESECNQCHERQEPHHHACRCLQHCKEGVYSY